MPVERFDELLITDETLAGLQSAGFTSMTRIQRETLPMSLEGRDLIACARTGSGKTLAFLIPVLESLTKECWSDSEGLGAVILTPTRELATQIFEVLQTIYSRHRNLSAGIITGGLELTDERRMISTVSIVIATPGRLRQHLDECAELYIDNLKVLVFDEADRLLDIGFSTEISAILGHITPSPDRLNLLFSATLPADLKIPKELGLRDAKYISVHDSSPIATPAKLCQNFIIVSIEKKIELIYNFIRQHERQKMIIFASTCNQIKFYYLILSRIFRDKGVPFGCLTGKMKQHQRLEVYSTFSRRSKMILFATDIACRGLDFYNLQWVVQFDCPDSVETYIHRVGRTARCGAKGCSLLMLTPEETDVLYFLHKAKLPLREIQVREGQLNNIGSFMVTEVAKGLKVEAQKAIISYIRSIYLAEHNLFRTLEQIDFVKFAQSFGLYTVPNLDKLNLGRRPMKNVSWEVRNKLLGKSQQRQKDVAAEIEYGSQITGEEKMTKEKNFSRAERARAAKHMQTQYDIMKSLNPAEVPELEILEAVADVSAPTAAESDVKFEHISNKSKRMFYGPDGVDLSVSKLKLAKHTIFNN